MLDTILAEIIAVILLIAISITGRIALVMIGQTWVETFAHTATLTLLPVITFVITNVIAGNIALSLGMVGALSIVRFRNPVKSPFELSTYFAAITMGIAASVSLKWLVFFVGALGLALGALWMMSKISPYFLGKPYFQTSFSEGGRLSTLEVEAKSPIPMLRDSDSLISESHHKDVYSYILASNGFPRLQSQMRGLEGNDAVIEARLNK